MQPEPLTNWKFGITLITHSKTCRASRTELVATLCACIINSSIIYALLNTIIFAVKAKDQNKPNDTYRSDAYSLLVLRRIENDIAAKIECL